MAIAAPTAQATGPATTASININDNNLTTSANQSNPAGRDTGSMAAATTH